MKYKVGDKVLIRSDLETNGYYGGCKFANWLSNMRGKVVTIMRAEVHSFGDRYTTDMGSFISDEMIERRIDMFTKDDLKVGYVTKNRDGKFEMVVPSQYGDALVGGGCDGYLTGFKEDLTYPDPCREFDIVEVYGFAPTSSCALAISAEGRPLLWQREEPPTELTIEEIAKKWGVPAERIRIKE